ncbi:hypothetical protein CAOG_08605 [Capsaspora owczarzaki ATCC 30864]|uniref:UBA domain-containing protein n=1 Tax=Capsaspora owczarzaki (strain ATCC 30864) TaxID=595528 RepID=A0A0D2U835_CAPO3|nr:hypothetical protein CAOG_08605 [Capsaspora owczarzaki ATCC 30864]KJE91266.1 hypothetical protein CAOG_008605 [Capsaspora owczarzaki ATCC 30864]|eukprot:XP_011270205.1 hypothetical protein CAOG_08605 [Capsaspora owczarzaki ATCC 30864]
MPVSAAGSVVSDSDTPLARSRRGSSTSLSGIANTSSNNINSTSSSIHGSNSSSSGSSDTSSNRNNRNSSNNANRSSSSLGGLGNLITAAAPPFLWMGQRSRATPVIEPSAAAALGRPTSASSSSSSSSSPSSSPTGASTATTEPTSPANAESAQSHQPRRQSDSAPVPAAVHQVPSTSTGGRVTAKSSFRMLHSRVQQEQSALAVAAVVAAVPGAVEFRPTFAAGSAAGERPATRMSQSTDLPEEGLTSVKTTTSTPSSDASCTSTGDSGFARDAALGLTSETFDIVTHNIESADTRQGLEHSDELVEIMNEFGVGFDQARLIFMRRRMIENNIDPDTGLPLDAKAVSFGPKPPSQPVIAAHSQQPLPRLLTAAQPGSTEPATSSQASLATSSTAAAASRKRLSHRISNRASKVLHLAAAAVAAATSTKPGALDDLTSQHYQQQSHISSAMSDAVTRTTVDDRRRHSAFSTQYGVSDYPVPTDPGRPRPPIREQIALLVDMGFAPNHAAVALLKAHRNVSIAAFMLAQEETVKTSQHQDWSSSASHASHGKRIHAPRLGWLKDKLMGGVHPALSHVAVQPLPYSNAPRGGSEGEPQSTSARLSRGRLGSQGFAQPDTTGTAGLNPLASVHSQPDDIFADVFNPRAHSTALPLSASTRSDLARLHAQAAHTVSNPSSSSSSTALVTSLSSPASRPTLGLRKPSAMDDAFMLPAHSPAAAMASPLARSGKPLHLHLSGAQDLAGDLHGTPTKSTPTTLVRSLSALDLADLATLATQPLNPFDDLFSSTSLDLPTVDPRQETSDDEDEDITVAATLPSLVAAPSKTTGKREQLVVSFAPGSTPSKLAAMPASPRGLPPHMTHKRSLSSPHNAIPPAQPLFDAPPQTTAPASPPHSPSRKFHVIAAKPHPIS